MDMVNIKINGMACEVPAGSTILEAAREAGIDIPTLCFLKDINQIGACRMCMVEVKGARSLVAACAGASVNRETSWARPMPAPTPMSPPRLVSTAASVRNCHKMRLFLAPMAFFRPISLVRSVTDTSMMFITPMPPPRGEQSTLGQNLPQ